MIEEGCATDTPRKRILIVNNNMHIGGVQKALVNLLKEIASEYEVTLLLFYKGGELLRDVPENVQVITACKALRGWGATREDAAGLRLRLSRAFSAAVTRIAGRKWICRFLFPFQKKLRGYDADSFAAEAARIEETPGLDSSLPDCIEAGGKTYYLVNGETGGFYGFSSYCDDEILDGKPYCMDVAAVDTQRMSIEYLTAFQWDAGKDEFVVGFLSPLLE